MRPYLNNDNMTSDESAEHMNALNIGVVGPRQRRTTLRLERVISLLLATGGQKKPLSALTVQQRNTGWSNRGGSTTARRHSSAVIPSLPAAVGAAPANMKSFSPASSSVADKDVEPIDNKIEQAMDLVKSHLLLAVREEVDVLKANITKLVDRIGSLERENAVLRGSVSADVLAQLEVPSTASSATAASSSSSVTPTGPLSRV